MAISVEEFTKFIGENKGKRKFKQSVELAVNFKGIDFNKQDNRLNLEILLPNGKGKVKKIAIFANDKNIIEEARKNNVDVIESSQIDNIATDKKRLESLLDYELVAQQNVMPVIARSLGQFLGPRNRMPKPLMANASLKNIVNDLNKRIVIRSKGKYLPTIHSIVGSEDMDASKIYENINEIITAIAGKVGQNNLRSAYVKLTMSKPVKFM